MSQRREKRLRQLERHIATIDTRLTVAEQSTRAAHYRLDTVVSDAWWERTPYSAGIPPATTTRRKSLSQRLADIFRKDR